MLTASQNTVKYDVREAFAGAKVKKHPPDWADPHDTSERKRERGIRNRHYRGSWRQGSTMGNDGSVLPCRGVAGRSEPRVSGSTRLTSVETLGICRDSKWQGRDSPRQRKKACRLPARRESQGSQTERHVLEAGGCTVMHNHHY